LYIDSLRGVDLCMSGQHIWCFNQINRPLLILFLSPCSPNIQQLMVQYVLLHSYVDGLFQYFSFSYNFFLSPTSCNPFRQMHSTILFSFSLSISLYVCVYIYIWLYMYLYTHLTYRSSFHIWGKYATFDFLGIYFLFSENMFQIY
jgi:hypothetical protein